MKTVTWLFHFILLLVCGLSIDCSSARAADWPQWRGTQRNGHSQETGLLKEWPKDGPRLVWQVKDIGSGFSTPSIVGERIYLLSNRGLDNEFVQALSVKDAKPIWNTRLGKVGNPEQQPNYPAARSTPTVEGAVLYALGSDGDLACVETASGKVRWQKNLKKDFGGKPGLWAYAESPLIDGDTLVCTPGGSEATIVALNKNDGSLLWKCAAPGGDNAAYASAIVVEAGGVKQYVQLLENGLVGVEAKTGRFLWRYAKVTSRYKNNDPTPVAADSIVYAGSGGTGGGAVRLNAKDGGIEAEPAYFSPRLPSAIGGAVKVGDYLYGTSSSLQCVDFKTGTPKWEERAIGAASICFADGRLYLHGENGEVALVEATPEGYREKGRFTPVDPPDRGSAKAWAYPVVCDGKLYIRDIGTLWCYDVKK